MQNGYYLFEEILKLNDDGKYNFKTKLKIIILKMYFPMWGTCLGF